MGTVDEWAQADDERSEFLRRAFLTLWFQKANSMQYVARIVGGQNFSRSRPGDEIVEGADEPGLTPVPAEVQREALSFLSETIFSDDFFEAEAGLLHRIHSDRLPGLMSYPVSRIDFPAHATILRAQSRSLNVLTDPDVLQRVYDAEIKATADGETDPFTASELLKGVRESVWRGLGDGSIASIRRNLQQQHVKSLLAMADSNPGQLMSADLRNQVRHEARLLLSSIESALQSELDAATTAHLYESHEQIKKILKAPHMKGGSGGGDTIILMLGQDD